MYAPYQPNLMGDILYIKISVSDSLAGVYLGFKSVPWYISNGTQEEGKQQKDSFACLGHSCPDK